MRPKPLARGARPAFRPRRRPLVALRRHPRLWWGAVLAAAALVGWIVAGTVTRADEAASEWGDSVRVLIATQDLDAGVVIGPGDVRLVDRPRSSTPPGALTELPDGQALSSAVYEGEALLRERLAPAGLDGLAATLPAGTRAVAIPVEPGLAPPLQVGDVVDVLVALAPEHAGSGPPGFVLASDALVVDVGEHAVAVAVERSMAPRVAVALGSGAVTLALVGA